MPTKLAKIFKNKADDKESKDKMLRVCLKLTYELSGMFGIGEDEKPTEFKDFVTFFEVDSSYSEMQR